MYSFSVNSVSIYMVKMTNHINIYNMANQSLLLHISFTMYFLSEFQVTLIIYEDVVLVFFCIRNYIIFFLVKNKTILKISKLQFSRCWCHGLAGLIFISTLFSE